MALAKNQFLMNLSDGQVGVNVVEDGNVVELTTYVIDGKPNSIILSRESAVALKTALEFSIGLIDDRGWR